LRGSVITLGEGEAMAMTDTVADKARLMKVVEAVILECERQGVAEALSNLGFDPTEMAKAVIRAADGDVIPFPTQQ
jgi:Holliday junction resolvasome RuvABC DNA-binding subunit